VKVVSQLRENVDLVIADPPFNLGKVYEEKMDRGEYLEWCKMWISACANALSDSGSIFLMTYQAMVGEMMHLLEMEGLHFKNMIVWFNSSMPVKNRFCIGYQPILWYVKNTREYTFNYGAQQRVSTAALPWGRQNNSHSIKDIWDDIPFISGGCMASKEAILEPGTKRKAHPAQMPLALAERMLLYASNEGDVILDPFMGSGTVPFACKVLRRRCIGVEKYRSYYDLILSRLDALENEIKRSPEEEVGE